jgi:hypothetical protein
MRSSDGVLSGRADNGQQPMPRMDAIRRNYYIRLVFLMDKCILKKHES